MKIISLIILTLVLSSCSIGKQGVFYEEMESPPKLTITDNNITVETKNSIRHSALLLYKIETELNKENMELSLTGLQAANEKYKTTFEFKLNTLGIEEIDDWTINWIDPNGKKHELKK